MPSTKESQVNAIDAAPLSGLRVLDLTRILVGPYCTQQLADLGADVIKIESPGSGDDTRRMKPPEQGGEAHFYLAFNRNKRSVALNLKAPGSKAVFDKLLAWADVLIENFRPGVTSRLGIDYASVRDAHPRLIYCSVSAYGQSGVHAQLPGFDPVLQAEMGFMSLTGEPAGQEMRHPLSLTDMFTAHYATSSILAAVLVQRERGAGQHIDLSLMDGAIASLGNVAQYYLASGRNPPRMGNSHVAAYPVGLFESRDGVFYLACGTDRLFDVLCTDVLEAPELSTDERFKTNSARNQNRGALTKQLSAHFAKQTTQAWLERMRSAGVPCGPVRQVSEALESEEVRERGLIHTVQHPTAGDIEVLGSPVRLSETPVVAPTAPPLLGEHTDDVLAELGLSTEQIATLRADDIIE
ncbi:MAG: CoA transferase [Gammaproteobacteria bacterium]|nr:CoA transferase [Gammaproteobacteria bacterium]